MPPDVDDLLAEHLQDDAMERKVHPIAAAFVSFFDQVNLTEGLPPEVVRFASCSSGELARRLFGEALLGVTRPHIQAMTLAFLMGWRAHAQESLDIAGE